MKILKKILALTLVFALGIGAGYVSEHPVTENSRFQAFTEKLFQTEVSANALTLLADTELVLACSGGSLSVLPADARGTPELHIPVLTVRSGTAHVRVGLAPHPMVPEHWIEWIVLETQQGFSVRRLRPGDAPEALFALPDTETAVGAYAYCNLHGLWQSML